MNISAHLIVILPLAAFSTMVAVFAQSPGESFDRYASPAINTTNITGSVKSTNQEMVEPIPTTNMSSGQRTNWLEVCKSPIIDSVVEQPCETLATPDGYHLSAEGIRVFACILGAHKLMEYDPTGSKTAEVREIANGTGIC